MFSPDFLWPKLVVPRIQTPHHSDRPPQDGSSFWMFPLKGECCTEYGISSFFHQLGIERLSGGQALLVIQGSRKAQDRCNPASRSVLYLEGAGHAECQVLGSWACRVPGAALIFPDHHSFVLFMLPKTALSYLISTTNHVPYKLGQCQAPVVPYLCSCIYFIHKHSCHFPFILLATPQDSDLLKSFKY